jgi:hypothetical protein
MTIHQRPVAPTDAVRLDAGHLAIPSAALAAAIARHRHAATDTTDGRDPESWDSWVEEEAAYNDLVAVPCLSRGDALAFLAHVRPTFPADPAADTLSKLADLLARALDGEFQAQTTTGREG